MRRKRNTRHPQPYFSDVRASELDEISTSTAPLRRRLPNQAQRLRLSNVRRAPVSSLALPGTSGGECITVIRSLSGSPIVSVLIAEGRKVDLRQRHKFRNAPNPVAVPDL